MAWENLALIISGIFGNDLCEVEPAAYAFVRIMINTVVTVTAGNIGCIGLVIQHSHDNLGKIKCIGRGSCLVEDNSQLRSCSSQIEHRLHEILPELAV